MANIFLKTVVPLVSSAEHENCPTDMPGCGVPVARNRRSVSSFSLKGPAAGGGFGNCDFQGPTIKE